MAHIIDMPKLSDTMTVGTLAKWLKQEGDAVHTGDMLAEVETDKATMELESFFDGILLRQFVRVGTQVPIGAALCAVGEKGEKVEAPAPPPAVKVAKPAAPAAAAAKPEAGSRVSVARAEKPEIVARGTSAAAAAPLPPQTPRPPA
ncbi:MAG TPA: biotin/lipoyl-containing protein, partial [Opitutaceae bacterium]|nr:biotin/lipoyl-containing protein [Opitutaceae bacterium]